MARSPLVKLEELTYNYMNKFFASSVDPEQVSLTIKGVFTLLVPLVTILVNRAGHNLDNTQVVAMEDAVTNVIVIGSSLISAFMILFGLFRKVMVSLK